MRRWGLLALTVTVGLVSLGAIGDRCTDNLPVDQELGVQVGFMNRSDTPIQMWLGDDSAPPAGVATSVEPGGLLFWNARMNVQLNPQGAEQRLPTIEECLASDSLAGSICEWADSLKGWVLVNGETKRWEFSRADLNQRVRVSTAIYVPWDGTRATVVNSLSN
ncbi:MAG: hypothetical protein AMXMBFR23_27970 [Chloroflexota bacterium]